MERRIIALELTFSKYIVTVYWTKLAQVQLLRPVFYSVVLNLLVLKKVFIKTYMGPIYLSVLLEEYLFFFFSFRKC